MNERYLASRILGSAKQFVLFVVLITVFFSTGVGLAYVFAIRNEQPQIISSKPESITEENQIGLGSSQKLRVNAQLQVLGQFYLAPSSVPASAAAGTMVFDQDTNTLQYYNGTVFVPLTGQTAPQGGVSSLQGQTGAITLAPGAGISINGTAIANSGILGVNGVGGDISVTTANGIASLSLLQSIATTASPTFDGLTLSGLAANGVVVPDGSGNLTSVTAPVAGQCLISTAGAPAFGLCAGGGAGVGSVNGLTGNLVISNASGLGTTITIDDASTTAKGIASFNSTNFSVVNGAVNTIQNIATTSSPTFAGLTLTAPLSVANGGIGASSLTLNAVLIGNGTSTPQQLTTVTPNQCLISTVGAPIFTTCPGSGGVASIDGQTGTVTMNNATGSGGAITIDDADTTTKGIASFNSTNFSVSSGAVNTIQGIATTSSPTFAGLTLTSALTVGNGGTGSTSAFGARSNLGAAASGANADITSLTALTAITPGAALTIGASGQILTLQGNANTTLVANNGGFATTVGFVTPTANVALNFPALSAGTYSICTSSGNCLGGGGGANTALSNLASVAINTSLLPGATTIDLGSSAAPFRDLYLGGTATNNFQFTGTASAARTITIPDATGTICLDNGNCAGVGGTGDILNNGQNGTVRIGSNNGNSTILESNNVDRLTIDSTGAATFSGTLTVTGLTTLNGGLTVETGDTFTFNGDAFTDLTGTGLTVSGNALQTTLGTSVDLASAEVTNTLGIGNGGTNATTAQGAINNLSGLTTNGDLLYHNGTNSTRLARGSDTQCLLSNATTILWGACTGGSLFTDGGTQTYLTATGDELVVGGSASLSAKLAVVNTSDQEALVIRAHSAQTDNNPLVLFQDSVGAEIARLTAINTNLYFGNLAGGNAQSGNVSNIGFGDNALESLTSGDNNIGIGVNSLQNVTSRDNNLAIGVGALTLSDDGFSNIALGNFAMNNSASGSGNIALGISSLYNTTGSNNIAIGYQAGDNLTSGSSNILIGFDLEASSATVSNELRIGSGSTITLQADLSTMAATFNGALTVSGLTTLNGGLTVEAGDTFTFNGDAFTDLTGTGLTVSGNALQTTLGTSVDLASAEVTNTLGLGNGGTNATTAQGAINNISGLTTNGDLLYHNGTNSTRLARGSNGECLTSNATTILWGSCGSGSSLFTDGGTQTYLTATGDELVVGGSASLSAKLSVVGTSDQEQLVIRAFSSQTDDNPLLVFQASGGTEIARLTAISSNLFFGNNAGGTAQSGNTDNVGLGSSSLDSLTNGDGNIAIGTNSLTANTTGSDNIAIGSNALANNQSTDNNIAIGLNSLNVLTSGGNNIAIGDASMQFSTNAQNNVAIGASALNQNDAGWEQVAIGTAALSSSNGDHNIGIGYQAGNNITTGTNNIIIGHDVDAASASTSNQLRIGYNTTITIEADLSTMAVIFNGTVQYANGTANTNTAVCRNSSGQLAGCTSASRYKDDVQGLSIGLEELRMLQPVSYTWNTNGQADIGFLAEQVAAVIPQAVTYDENGDVASFNYNTVSALLVSGIKELDLKVTALETRLVAVEQGNFAGNVTVAGGLKVEGLAELASLKVNGKIIGNPDTRGVVSITAGATMQAYTFASAYSSVPNIVLTPKTNPGAQYWVGEVTLTGFKVYLAVPTSSNVEFNFQAQQ